MRSGSLSNNFYTMKILDVSGNEIKACVKIHSENFTISLSTIFTPSSLAVFDANGKDVTALIFDSEPAPNAKNIQKSLAWAWLATASNFKF